MPVPFVSRILTAVICGVILVSCSLDPKAAVSAKGPRALTLTVWEGSDAFARPVANAAVSAGGVQAVTSATGVVTVTVAEGAVPLTISKNGYRPYSGSVTVGGGDKAWTIYLDPNQLPSQTDDAWSPGTGWTLKWADEFTAPGIDPTRWTRQVEPAGKFNNELQSYTSSSDNAFVTNRVPGDGVMVIQALQTGALAAKGAYTSARMITHGHQDFTYGKIAARIQLPAGKGLWPAFWMLGSNISENAGGTVPWPQCGEIDILELRGSNPSQWTGAFHYANASNAWQYQTNAATITPSLSADFHVYEMEWSKSALTWRVDGQQVYTADITDPMYDEFRQPFYILLNLAVGGSFDGPPAASVTFPQRMFIDWVRVYQ